MDFLNFLAKIPTSPNDLWGKLINWLEGGILNYAVVLIVLTLLIRVVLVPFDFYNKIVSKKNMQMQMNMRPELEKINKLYANNPNMKNQKLNELYKKNGFNIYGTCFGMLFYLVLTSVIFFSLFATLNKMSAFKLYQEYTILNDTYIATEAAATNEYNLNPVDGVTVEVYAKNAAEQAVVIKYGEIKNGFLWITNIWRPDTGAKVTLNYKTFLKTTGVTAEEITQESYEKIMNPIQTSYNGWNGYFILAILNAGLTVLSMCLSDLASKIRAKKKGLPYVSAMGQNKAMMVVMPLIMAMFLIFNNAAFGIYIVTGSLFMCVTSPLISLAVDALVEKKNKKNKKDNKPIYSR